MKANQGTPRTLREAIENGRQEGNRSPDAAQAIEMNVRDFLAQKFTIAILKGASEEELKTLFEEIFH